MGLTRQGGNGPEAPHRCFPSFFASRIGKNPEYPCISENSFRTNNSLSSFVLSELLLRPMRAQSKAELANETYMYLQTCCLIQDPGLELNSTISVGPDPYFTQLGTSVQT